MLLFQWPDMLHQPTCQRHLPPCPPACYAADPSCAGLADVVTVVPAGEPGKTFSAQYSGVLQVNKRQLYNTRNCIQVGASAFLYISPAPYARNMTIETCSLITWDSVLSIFYANGECVNL